MPDERRAARPKTRFAHAPRHHADRDRALRAHHGHTAGAANSGLGASAHADVRDGRSAITLPSCRALVRPPGNAHLEGQVARAHVLRQRSGPAARHAARRLPPRCDDRAWRLRHHLPRLRHAARQGRRDQGIPADRVRHPPRRRRRSCRAARAWPTTSPGAASASSTRRARWRASVIPISCRCCATSRPTARPIP